MSKRKKKNRVTRLTERDYGNYIMSLKDEDPAKVISKKAGENDRDTL